MLAKTKGFHPDGRAHLCCVSCPSPLLLPPGGVFHGGDAPLLSYPPPLRWCSSSDCCSPAGLWCVVSWTELIATSKWLPDTPHALLTPALDKGTPPRAGCT